MRTRNVTGIVKSSPLKKSRAYDVSHLTLINIFLTVGYTLERFISNAYVAKFKTILYMQVGNMQSSGSATQLDPKFSPAVHFAEPELGIPAQGKRAECLTYRAMP